MAALKTGGDVDAHCNRCKLVLAHVIIAMEGSRPVRVECKTCRGVHNYKRQASAATTERAAAKRATRPGGARNKVGPSQYDDVIRGQDLSRAQRYRATVHYEEGDVLDHPTFQIGVVMRLLSDSKIEVLFPAGVKVLVHARGAVA